MLKGIQFKYVMSYIDDLICYSATFESHLVHLRDMFTRLRQADLKLKPSKCQFAVLKHKYLGKVYCLLQA